MTCEGESKRVATTSPVVSDCGMKIDTTDCDVQASWRYFEKDTKLGTSFVTYNTDCIPPKWEPTWVLSMAELPHWTQTTPEASNVRIIETTELPQVLCLRQFSSEVGWNYLQHTNEE